MRCSQSREKLFPLLDLTEYMMMDLTDATLDQQICELFTRLYLGGEQCGCGEQMMACLFDVLRSAGWDLGGYRVPSGPWKAWRSLTPSW